MVKQILIKTLEKDIVSVQHKNLQAFLSNKHIFHLTHTHKYTVAWKSRSPSKASFTQCLSVIKRLSCVVLFVCACAVWQPLYAFSAVLGLTSLSY